jgi:hypothetical protein
MVNILKRRSNVMAAKKKAKKPAPKKSPVKAKKTAAKSAAPKMHARVAAKSPMSTRTLTPLDDRILVALEEAATKTAGGLYIPDSAKGTPVRGLVVAVGRGRRNKRARSARSMWRLAIA